MGYLRKPAPTHCCVKPRVEHGDVGAVWRCGCRKLWIYRTGWYFGEFPPSFHRTISAWHRARWWERLRWLFAVEK